MLQARQGSLGSGELAEAAAAEQQRRQLLCMQARANGRPPSLQELQAVQVRSVQMCFVSAVHPQRMITWSK